MLLLMFCSTEPNLINTGCLIFSSLIIKYTSSFIFGSITLTVELSFTMIALSGRLVCVTELKFFEAGTSVFLPKPELAFATSRS